MCSVLTVCAVWIRGGANEHGVPHDGVMGLPWPDDYNRSVRARRQLTWPSARGRVTITDSLLWVSSTNPNIFCSGDINSDIKIWVIYKEQCHMLEVAFLLSCLQERLYWEAKAVHGVFRLPLTWWGGRGRFSLGGWFVCLHTRAGHIITYRLT